MSEEKNEQLRYKTAEGLIRFVQSDLKTFVNNDAIKDEYKEAVSQLLHANWVLLDRALEKMKIEKKKQEMAVNDAKIEVYSEVIRKFVTKTEAI